MKKFILSGLILCVFSACETDFSNGPTSAPTIQSDSSSLPTINAALTIASARAYGKVLSSGNLEVERGAVWDDTVAEPTLENSDVILKDGTKGIGNLNLLLNNLPPGITLNYRLYAKNYAGTSYSQTRTLVTPKGKPQLILKPISSVVDTTATLSAVISYTGGEPLTSKGFLVGTMNNPSLTNGAIRIDASNLEAGPYTAAVTGLLRGKRYNVRAFAENSLGVNYSRQLNFNTNP